MDKKLKKVLVWSSVISVVCVIFLYSISYVFPIPAITIPYYKSKMDERINVSPLAEFYDLHKEFVKSLENKRILFSRYLQNKHTFYWSDPEIYTFSIDSQTYMKPLFYNSLKDRDFLSKSDFNAIKVDGNKLVAFFESSEINNIRFFIYNEANHNLTEYFINGKIGRKYFFNSDPSFIFDFEINSEIIKKLFVLDEKKILFIADTENEDYTYSWNIRSRPSGFQYIHDYDDVFTSSGLANFIAYNGDTFYIFNSFESKFISKQRLSEELEQLIPDSQVYRDSENTYLLTVNHHWHDETIINVDINLNRILKHSISPIPILEKINTNNVIHYFFGKQNKNYFNLEMYYLYNFKNKNIHEIHKYKFIIPGTVSSCERIDDSIYLFDTDIGRYILPETKPSTSILADKYLTNLDLYPYETIFGEDNFAIKNISHTIFEYHGRSYNLLTLIKAIFTGDRSYITYIILFYLILYAYLKYRAISRKENNDTSDNE